MLDVTYFFSAFIFPFSFSALLCNKQKISVHSHCSEDYPNSDSIFTFVRYNWVSINKHSDIMYNQKFNKSAF